MKINAYMIVFGVIAAVVVLAALSTTLFNKASQHVGNVSVSSLHDYGPAPQIQGIAGWINSPPINLTQLKGKVVLMDFWTYSCINCIRSIPYLNAWYQKYGNDGLVIIGVSTPEFAFEHNYTNVKNAAEKFGIRYPVALDNNYATWTAYNNHYWPADYLINASGDIVYESFGEGNFNQTEETIKALLASAGYSIPPGLVNLTDPANFSMIKSEETYLGYATARFAIGNSQGFDPNTTVNYLYQAPTVANEAYFSGEWYNAPDSMIAVNDSKLYFIYSAKSVNIVASGNGNSSTIRIYLDGKNLNQSYAGNSTAISNGVATANISSPQLYNIIDGPSYGEHTLEINASPGFRIYTFTFG